MSSSFKPATTGDHSELVPSEAEMRLRLILDHSLDMMAFVRVEPGPVFRVVYINEKYMEGIGRSGFALTKEDLMNKTVDEVLRKIQASPSLTEQVLLRYSEAARSMRPQRYEEIIETTQGRYYGESVLTPGADSSGGCALILYTSREVTERKLAEKKIQRLNRLYAVSSSINQAIVRIRDTGKLYEQACRIAVEEGLLRMAWVGLPDPATGAIKPVSSWGFNDGYTDAITISLSDMPPEGHGPGGRAFRSGICHFSNDIAKDTSFASRAEAFKRGYRSCAAFPLKVGGIVTGILVIYADQVDYFNDEELRLLNALAENISFAVESLEKEMERGRVEMALRMSEEQYRNVFETVAEGLTIIELDGRIVEGNPAVCKMLGYTCDEFVRLKPADFIHPDSMNLFYTFVQEVGQGRRFNCEAKGVRKDGTVIPVEVQGSPFSYRGRPHLLSIVRDVSARRTAEESLRKNEEELRVTFENAAISIALVNMAGHPVKCNPALEKFLGYSEKELRRMSFAEFTHPEDVEADMVLYRELMAGTRDHYEIEKRFIHRNGEIKWGRLTASLVRGAGQEPQYGIGMVEDITEYKRSRAELRESEDRFKQLAENIQEVFWMANTVEAEVLYVSPAYEEIWGRTRESLYQSPKAWMENIHPEDRQRVADAVEKKQVIGQYDEEYRIIRPDGEIRWISDRGFPIKDETGHIYRIAGVAQDITRRKQAEQAVQESQARLQAILDNSPNLVFMKDLEGRYLLVNRQFAKSFHLTREQIIGRMDTEFLPAAQAALYRGNDRKVLKQGELMEFTETMENPHRISVVHKFPLRDSSGTIKALCGIATDITERILVEEQLRRSESLLGHAQRIAGLGSWSYDFATRLVEWSPATLEIFRLQSGEFPGTLEAFFEMVHPEDRQGLIRAQEEALRGGKMIDQEYRIVLRDGSVRNVQERGEVVCDEHGVPLKRVGSILDVTESRRKEQLLREQAALLDKAQDAILVRNMNDEVVYWNKSAERLYGYTMSEAAGRKITDLIYKDTTIFDETRQALLTKGEWHGEIAQVTKSGREVLVEARWTLVRNDQGEPQSVLAINTDITEKKKLENQFLRAQRMESIGTLAGGIAHDLNNVLAPILMSCELLEHELRDAEIREVISSIKTGAQRGADLVRQVLSFARGVEGRRLALQPRHLIREIEQIMGETFPKSIQVDVSPDPELWMVVGDPTQLHQVLLNLCVNARDAMPAGGQLTLSAGNVLREENQLMAGLNSQATAYVVIRVADTGTGIPPELREKIFDPFFTTKEVGKGTGLGLSTTLAIIKSHDGFIHVSSEPGRGSTFEIYLPAQKAASKAASSRNEPELPRGNGELILLVEDEPSILKITQRTLEGFGYRVLTAANGADAVGIYSKHGSEVAVVVTDMMMPVMDGSAMIHALRSMNPQVKVIASSGLSTPESMHRTTEMGVPFLAKPYKAEALLSALREMIDGR